MKRILSLFLIVALLLAGSAAADPIDLSGMTFDQLVALRDQLNLAIWNSQEWQEVTVPVGIYQVGVDIPAGYWHISAKEYSYTQIYYFEKLNQYKTDPDPLSGYMYSLFLKNLGEADNVSTDIDMKNGMYFMAVSESVIFTPYTGKPDLGLK